MPLTPEYECSAHQGTKSRSRINVRYQGSESMNRIEEHKQDQGTGPRIIASRPCMNLIPEYQCFAHQYQGTGPRIIASLLSCSCITDPAWLSYQKCFAHQCQGAGQRTIASLNQRTGSRNGMKQQDQQPVSMQWTVQRIIASLLLCSRIITAPCMPTIREY